MEASAQDFASAAKSIKKPETEWQQLNASEKKNVKKAGKAEKWNETGPIRINY